MEDVAEVTIAAGLALKHHPEPLLSCGPLLAAPLACQWYEAIEREQEQQGQQQRPQFRGLEPFQAPFGPFS